MAWTQIGPALLLIGVGIAIIDFARRKSWLGVTASCCLALSQLSYVAQFPGVDWVGFTFSLLFLVCVLALVWKQSRDPDWRASWRK
jgi:hypothetical protein